MSPPLVSRPVQARTVRNTQQILRAALEACADEGWPGLLTQRVAARSGLAGPTVRGRFADRSVLAAELWSKSLAAPVLEAVGDVVETCTDVSDRTRQLAVEATKKFLRPDVGMTAALELMIVSLFDPVVHEAVDSSLGEALRGWLRSSNSNPPTDAARRAYGVSIALGLGIHGLALTRRPPDVSSEIERRWSAMSSGIVPPELPNVSDKLWDEPIQFGTGDPTWDAVLRATMDEVGRRGFEAATVAKIAESSGYTQGAIFSRYPSKRDLFLDATERMVAISSLRNEVFHLDLIEKYGPGMAEAIMLRGFMKPSRRALQVINMEQFRIAWHDTAMKKAIQDAMDINVDQQRRQPSTVTDDAAAWVHCEYALGVGVVLLAAMCPAVVSLPFQAVTIPLLEGS